MSQPNVSNYGKRISSQQTTNEYIKRLAVQGKNGRTNNLTLLYKRKSYVSFREVTGI